MDQAIKQLFEDRFSEDPQRRYHGYLGLIAATEGPVDWAYRVWDLLAADLTRGDNHERSFSAQLLSRLAVSDPEGRMNTLFPALFEVTRDHRTVTARHALQSVWRVGLASSELRARVTEALVRRFHEAGGTKQASIFRPDVIAALRRLYDASGDEAVKTAAERLQSGEADPKALKKLEASWRKPFA